MNVYAISALVNVATSVVLGLLVFLADKRGSVNRLFALFAASVAFWSYSYFAWQIATDAQGALLWTHLLMFGATFITPVYLHFCCRFLGIEREQRLIIASGYFFIVVFGLLNWSSLYISGVVPLAGFDFWPEAGPLFAPFLVFWVFYAAYPVYLLAVARRKESPDKASAISYILAGTIIGYAGGCTNYFLWYHVYVLPFGNISASVYLSLVAYAIMRHRLFNMKVIATELLVFSIWLIVFVRLLLAESVESQLIDGTLLAILLVTGTMLIRSVDKEVEQRELIQAQEKKLEQANRQQETLLHFISHEIKGYLTKNQAAFAAIATGDYGAVPPQLAEMSQAALIDTRKGVATVMDILDASNLKSGTVSYDKKPIDLATAVDEVVHDLRAEAQEKGLQLSFTKPVTGAYTIEGDGNKLRHHVLRNIIDNSIKYTPSGSVAVELTRDHGRIRMTVTDTGVGITPEDMPRLFTEGGHGKESIKVNVHSTGYGLFIAKQVVDAHGGKIWAESGGAGKGSRFIIEFPLSA